MTHTVKDPVSSREPRASGSGRLPQRRGDEIIKNMDAG